MPNGKSTVEKVSEVVKAAAESGVWELGRRDVFVECLLLKTPQSFLGFPEAFLGLPRVFSLRFDIFG